MTEVLLARIGDKPLLYGGSRILQEPQGVFMEHTDGLGAGKVWDKGKYVSIKETEILVYRWLVEKKCPDWVNLTQVELFAKTKLKLPTETSLWGEVGSFYETVGKFYGFSIFDTYPNVFALKEVKQEWI